MRITDRFEAGAYGTYVNVFLANGEKRPYGNMLRRDSDGVTWRIVTIDQFERKDDQASLRLGAASSYPEKNDSVRVLWSS